MLKTTGELVGGELVKGAYIIDIQWDSDAYFGHELLFVLSTGTLRGNVCFYQVDEKAFLDWLQNKYKQSTKYDMDRMYFYD